MSDFTLAYVSFDVSGESAVAVITFGVDLHFLHRYKNMYILKVLVKCWISTAQ